MPDSWLMSFVSNELDIHATRITYTISSLMEIPPSFNMGVTSSARYNQIWGISMAMSSANSKVSEKLKNSRENINM